MQLNEILISMCSLYLFETNLSSIDGMAPDEIELTKYMEDATPKSLIIGRGSPAFPTDIIINARSDGKEIISRNHARLTYLSESGLWEIEDLKSLNGTFLNRKRITKSQLRHGDVLQLGGISNIAVGGILQVSDLCIKYRFSVSSVTKGKNKRVNTSTNIENSSALKKKRLHKTNDDNLEEAQAALNRLHASKDAQIVELKTNLKNSEKSFELNIALLQTRIQDLEKQEKEKEASFSSLHADYLRLQERSAILEKTNKELSNKCTDIGSRLKSLSEKAEAYKDDTCAITTSALAMILKCSLCQNVMHDPVIMHCSHGFCRSCADGEYASNGHFFCSICNSRMHEPKIAKPFVKSTHLTAIMLLLKQCT